MTSAWVVRGGGTLGRGSVLRQGVGGAGLGRWGSSLPAPSFPFTGGIGERCSPQGPVSSDQGAAGSP